MTADTADLDFPPIDAAPTDPSAVAIPAAQALDLERVDLQALALAKFKPAREQAAAAVKTLTGVEHDLSTQAKVDEAKSLRQRLINGPMADVRKLTKGLKSRLAAVSRAVGEEEDRTLAAFNAADALITPQIEAADKRLAAEREAKIQAEAARKARHEINLQRVAGAAQRARDTGADSAKIAEGIAGLEAYEVTEAWEEYRERAEEARLASIQALQALHVEVKAREEQAAENERLRLLAEQQAAELAALRKEREAREAAETQALVNSIRAESRRVERPNNEAYIRKAMHTFESMAPDWENDPREAVRDAISEGRRYLATLLSDAVATSEAAKPTPTDKEYTEGPDAQQVLKAEAATPDATARAIPADASPCGGTMGVEQPAAAGLAGERVTLSSLRGIAKGITFAEPEPADPLDDARAFVALVLTAFDGKFPTQPKMGPEWWQEVRATGEALALRLSRGAGA